MKKVFMGLGGVLLSLIFTSSLFAGAVDNKTNWSAEYIRTLNRNAATDFADIAAYNPAGTVKLAEGLIINGSIQFLAKDYENVVNGTSYESDEPSYVPGVFAVYNRGKWSLFGAFSNYGGGGKVDFSEGNWTTVQVASFFPSVTGQELTAESFYLGYSIGGAYKINDLLSASLGLRYITAKKELNASVAYAGGALSETFDFEQEGNGWGAVIGVNITPREDLTLAMRYETKTELELEATVNSGNPDILASFGVVHGQDAARDLPAVLALGASYQITPKLRTEVNYTYYFNEEADWSGAEESVNNGYDVGITFEYRFNEKILGSIGYLHTELGVDPANFLAENPELDADTFGGGIAYSFNEKFHTNVAIGNSFYADDTFVSPSGAVVEYKKNVFFLALGLEYRFM